MLPEDFIPSEKSGGRYQLTLLRERERGRPRHEAAEPDYVQSYELTTTKVATLTLQSAPHLKGDIYHLSGNLRSNRRDGRTYRPRPRKVPSSPPARPSCDCVRGKRDTVQELGSTLALAAMYLLGGGGGGVAAVLSSVPVIENQWRQSRKTLLSPLPSLSHPSTVLTLTV